uniref:Uncharacterized protein n=1 Tax=Cacopsylla melanoneura TaxID=428564 RepID=A0A8D8RMN7_9HEMI
MPNISSVSILWDGQVIAAEYLLVVVVYFGFNQCLTWLSPFSAGFTKYFFTSSSNFTPHSNSLSSNLFLAISYGPFNSRRSGTGPACEFSESNSSRFPQSSIDFLHLSA